MYKLNNNKTGVLVHADDVESSALDQIKLISNHPSLRGLISIMPDCHAGAGCVIGFTGKFGTSVIPNIVGVDIGCFSGDTKIPLLNGTQASLKELVDKGEFYVYSLDKKLDLVPGKAIALKTRTDAELMEVVVSGGEVIRCTPDHKFMLLDGSYKNAEDLKVFDSLMPLYRGYQTRDGYEYIKANKTGVITHKMVAEYFLGKRENEIIHHKHGLWFDNSPENLEYINPKEHSKNHRKEKCAFLDDDFQEKKKKTIEKRGFFFKTPESLEKKQVTASNTITNYMEENPEHFKNAVKDNGKRGATFLREFNKVNNSTEFTCECGRVTLGKGGHVKHQNSCEVHQTACNHKVLFTRKLDYKEDVYCLQVEEYHNFALSAGVFVHNCGVDTYNLFFANLDLPAIYDYIEKNIPAGFNSHKHRVTVNKDERKVIDDCEKLVKDLKLKANPSLQAGTLGGGNHFIEIEQNTSTGNQYLTVHSGSRKFGLEVAKYYQKKAKELMKTMNISVPNDLEYLPLGDGQIGDDYMHDMGVAQRYAELNRNLMLRAILKFMRIQYDEELVTTSTHNYISNRDGIIRKGAISAHCHEKLVIPLNMGKNGGIVLGTGLGNKNYNYSAPHGTGRTSGRNQMKRKLQSGEVTMEQFEETMEGIYTRSVVENTIDESPMAYRTLETIKEYLEQTVKITDIAHPILSFKDTTK